VRPRHALAFALAAASASAQSLAPRTPPDITAFVTPAELKALDAAMTPHAERARAAFPAARDRFLAGLRKGETLFVTARLYDERTWSELAAIRVSAVSGGIVEGRIWSKPRVAIGYRFGDAYALPDDHLIDWVLVHADGTEEGNFVKLHK